jgi:hypothetical protein
MTGRFDYGTGQPVHLRTLRSDRHYQRLDITGLTGITEAQHAALVQLGAFDGSVQRSSVSSGAHRLAGGNGDRSDWRARLVITNEFLELPSDFAIVTLTISARCRGWSILEVRRTSRTTEMATSHGNRITDSNRTWRSMTASRACGLRW